MRKLIIVFSYRMLSAEKVCDMLDRLYLAFDKLAGKHGIFKVETIGDAWMGVTNCKFQQSRFSPYEMHGLLNLFDRCCL